MDFKTYRPLVELTVATAIAFFVHLLIYYFLNLETSSFSYSVTVLYGAFFGIAFLIIALLMFVKRASINSVGSTMMLLTCLKMVPAFLIMSPAIRLNTVNPGFEKTNFLIIFLIFLLIETVIAIRLLNKP